MDALNFQISMDDLIFYGTIAFGFGVIVLLYILSKRTREDFIDAALALGFLSTPGMTQNVHGAIEKFRAFDEKGMFGLGPVVQIGRSGFKLSVFNAGMRFSGSGDSSLTTIAHARLHDFSFPDFSLKTPAFVVFAMIRGVDDRPNRITFDGHPEFSKRLWLEGEDESAIRALFTPRVLTYFEKKRKAWLRSGLNLGPINLGAKLPYLEARGNEIIFLFEGKVIAPKKLAQFIDDAVEVVRVFTRE